jgi:hypothetical protein
MTATVPPRILGDLAPAGLELAVTCQRCGHVAVVDDHFRTQCKRAERLRVGAAPAPPSPTEPPACTARCRLGSARPRARPRSRGCAAVGHINRLAGRIGGARSNDHGGASLPRRRRLCVTRLRMTLTCVLASEAGGAATGESTEAQTIETTALRRVPGLGARHTNDQR